MAPGDIHFFEADENWARGLDWYESHFAAAAGERRVGEKTPAYLFYDEAMQRIARTVPDAQLIAILRNPVDRAYSHYQYNKTWWGEGRTFAELVQPELDGHDGEPYLLARGRYLEQLERAVRLFSREQLAVFLLDDLEARPREILGATCRFLGIDDSFVPANPEERVNVAKRQRADRLHQFMLRHHVYRRIPEPLRSKVQGLMVADLDYSPMDPALRGRLVEYFRPFNTALGEWLGRDLSNWSTTAPARS
jgi:hypothetical protein